MTIWGTGSPRREFLHVDDLADAAVFLMQNYEAPEILNVGTGEDLTIRELAEMIGRVTGFRGGWSSTFETRRHAAKTARRAPAQCAWLEGPDSARRGDSDHV